MNAFERYGQLMVQKEILDNQINEAKQQINKEMNKEASGKKQKGSAEGQDGPTPAKDTSSKKS